MILFQGRLHRLVIGNGKFLRMTRDMNRSALFVFLALAGLFAGLSGELKAQAFSVPAEPGSLGAIPDGAGEGPGNYGASLDVRFEVDGTQGYVGSIGVEFSANHEIVADMRVRLIAPDGTEHLLFAQTGVTTNDSEGHNSNLVDSSVYSFADAASDHWWTAADFPSSFDIPSTAARTIPSGDINAPPGLPDFTSMDQAFLGTPMDGTWILRFDDGYVEFTGEVTAASLLFEFDTPDIVVTNANDAGPGSLRQAMVDAGEGETIAFDPGFFSTARTIELLSPLPVVDTSLFIDGPGADFLTVQRNSESATVAVFLTSQFEGRFAISGMRITGGVSGSGGAVSIAASSFRGSELDLDDNVALQGGGLAFIDGKNGMLLNSLVRDNSASSEGSGIYLECSSDDDCTFDIRNTTISGNETNAEDEPASIGLAVADGAEMFVDYFNNTLVGEGTGIRMIEEGSTPSLLVLEVGSSIFSVPSENIDFGSFIGASIALNRGFNLSRLADSFFASTGGQDDVDPQVSALADNGGPTLTHALEVTSPAIDNGQAFGQEFDQRGRGFPRTFDTGNGTIEGADGTDVGAFEFLPEDDIFSSRFELATGIIEFPDVNFTVNEDGTGGSIRWIDGTTCDCDDPPFDFNIWRNAGQLAFFWPRSTVEGGVTIDGGSTYAILLPGSTVGPDAQFTTSLSAPAASAWSTVSGQDAFLGFRFEDNGVTKYGYARIETGPNGSPATIVSYAFENNGGPITIP
jgi:hypothetical protein